MRNIDPKVPEDFKDLRPENLSVEDWLKLFKSR